MPFIRTDSDGAPVSDNGTENRYWRNAFYSLPVAYRPSGRFGFEGCRPLRVDARTFYSALDRSRRSARKGTRV